MAPPGTSALKLYDASRAHGTVCYQYLVIQELRPVPSGVLSRKSYEISGLREILYHTSRNQNIILSDEMLSVITWAGSTGSNRGADVARGDM